jgi:4-hydroxy-tetrahydrodipicolinate synthase
MPSRRPVDFHGIYASTILPLRPDGSIDEAATAAHVSAVARTPGMRGLLINGHAGENAFLSREECRRVVEIARDAVDDGLLVAGVNAEHSGAAVALARDAAEAGADAVMVFAPFSWALGADPRAVVAHHRAVHDATELPLFLFQGSVGAGRTRFNPDVLGQLLALERVVGIKEGSWEVAAYEQTRRLAQSRRPDVAVMASGDEHLFTSFVLGSDGSLVSLAVICPELIVALDEAVRRGDLPAAQSLHGRIQPLANAVYGTPPASLATARLKACLKLLGRIDNAACRPPIPALSASEVEDLRSALHHAGLSA